LIWFYLISGLFVGWSLGANDASIIFGTAVTTKMLKFKFAAAIASIFIILGAVLSGGGTTRTIRELGEVNALAGAFTVSLAAGLVVFVLIKNGYPVSVSQAIVGSIIGWCIFTSTPVDISSLTLIVLTWVVNPAISGLFAFIIFKLLKVLLKKINIHLLQVDLYTRIALTLVIIFGSYSLGANNIAKVIGVFADSNPFKDISIAGINFPAINQLFLLGSVAMAIGVLTFSKKNIETVGGEIYTLNPVTALASVLGSSVVLFIFSSQTIEKSLHYLGLPALPLVPVSITQSMVGAIIGISIAKGVRNLNFKILGKVGLGWIVTPVAAAFVCFISLFFIQNVFQAKIVNPISFEITESVIKEIKNSGINVDSLNKFKGSVFYSQYELRKNLNDVGIHKEDFVYKIFNISKIENFRIDSNLTRQKLSSEYFTSEQISELNLLHSKTFRHSWEIEDALSAISPEWQYLENTPVNKYFNKSLGNRYEIIFDTFRIKAAD